MYYKLKETDIPKMSKLNWDVQLQSNSYIEVDITNVGAKEMPYEQNESELIFQDYYIKYQAYMLHTEDKPKVYICPRDEKPTIDNLKEFDKSNWSVWGVKCFNVVYRDKHGFQTSATTQIYRNGVLFDTVGGRDMAYSLIEAQAIIHKLNDPRYPWTYFEIDYEKEIVGLRVKWRGRDAVITRYIEGQNAVMLDIIAEEDEFDAGEHIKDWLLSDSFDFWPKDK